MGEADRMIAWLQGTLVERDLGELVIVTAGGVGYAVSVSLQSAMALPDLGCPVTLHTYTHVREDTLKLFGFHAREEREAFEALLTIAGVGPKTALGVLSGLPLPELAQAVSAGDVRRISAAPGIGKKTAQRIALELKERFARWAGEPTAETDETALDELQWNELRSALLNLGYRPGDIERLVKRVREELGEEGDTPPIEQLVRLALRLARP
jgi:holliday junction DNA helicase RuvA